MPTDDDDDDDDDDDPGGRWVATHCERQEGGVLSAVHLLGEGGGGGVVNVHTHVVPQLAVLLTTCLSAVPLTPPGFTQNVVQTLGGGGCNSWFYSGQEQHLVVRPGPTQQRLWYQYSPELGEAVLVLTETVHNGRLKKPKSTEELSPK